MPKMPAVSASMLLDPQHHHRRQRASNTIVENCYSRNVGLDVCGVVVWRGIAWHGALWPGLVYNRSWSSKKGKE